MEMNQHNNPKKMSLPIVLRVMSSSQSKKGAAPVISAELISVDMVNGYVLA